MATIGTRLFTAFKGEFVGRDEFANRYYRREFCDVHECVLSDCGNIPRASSGVHNPVISPAGSASCRDLYFWPAHSILQHN